ncbi:MAG: hypothetical protein MI864_08460 [Pseudomonadales bacterium]|nr:hypothetical protein [Pseudomonadales bacterium]
MYKEKLLRTKVRTDNAKRLRETLINYCDFRQVNESDSKNRQLAILEQWQSQRLQETHADLHADPEYKEGLDFLLDELYAPKDFTQRDNDIDRIFPMMVRLLPDHLLYTVSLLVELNHLTQSLDYQLLDYLPALPEAPVDGLDISEYITEEQYAKAYRDCANHPERLHQIQLIANVGDDLNRYVRSKFLSFSLKVTKGAAEMAGVGALHQFLNRGFHAFQRMGDVEKMLAIIIERETHILDQIFQGNPTPFSLENMQPNTSREMSTPSFV